MSIKVYLIVAEVTIFTQCFSVGTETDDSAERYLSSLQNFEDLLLS